MAPLLANGSIGAWAPTTSFPNARYCHASVAYGGFLYVIAGLNADTLSDVVVAPINANGTLGAWSGTSPLTAGRYLEGVALDNGNLYATGGLGIAGNLGEVLVTRLLTPAPRGVYSQLIDFGGPVTSIDSLTAGGVAPANGARVLLDYQVAPASGIFGAKASRGAVTLGAPVTPGEANARYLWVRLTLDDSDTALVAPDAVNERDVGELSIAFTGGPTDAGADAGTDGGDTDGGPDAGATDGGSDAGSADAGVADAGVADAGTADAGTGDGGGPDGGSPQAPGVYTVGCSALSGMES